jgi:fructose-1,6-bisphosphatase I
MMKYMVDFPTQVMIDLGLTPRATMGEYVIDGEIGGDGFSSREELLRILTAIRLGAKVIAREINKGSLGRIAEGYNQEGVNVQGEMQHSLDFYAHQLFVQCLRSRNIVCGLVSEEEENIIEFNHQGSQAQYIVLTDPLDGSSNIDVNIPVGTIFSVVKRKTSPVGRVDDFLQPGTAIIAAGYVLYGSSTMLVFSAGKGVHGFTLDNSIGTLYLTHPDIRYPTGDEDTFFYSINEGNLNDFPAGVAEYIEFLQSRRNPARYVGSLVADFHRNLLKGGIYMYPPTKKHKQGKLRLQYEVNPLAFIAEQAGGKASTGSKRVLECSVKDIHQRSPFYVGPTGMVEKLELFLSLLNHVEAK